MVLRSNDRSITSAFNSVVAKLAFFFVANYTLSFTSLFVLRRRPGYAPAYRTWGYPVVPLVFIGGSIAFVLNTLVERPVQSIAGLGLLVLGLPAYWYWRRA